MREPLPSIRIATKLLFDILLPCSFTPGDLGLNKTSDIAAVWSQNDTADQLLEIKQQGAVMFWNNRSGRIQAFPESSDSGNFSILLHKVQLSDLGLYHCELFKGNICALAYQDIYINMGKKPIIHSEPLGLLE